MTTLQATRSLRSPSMNLDGLGRLMAEIRAFAAAMFNPGRFVEQGEMIRALQLQANRVEATDPDRAAALRRRIARIGLR